MDPVRSTKLFRGRLLLVLSRSRRGAGCQLIQVVLQEADLHAAAVRALGLAIASRGLRRSIAHADEVDAVDRDVMIGDQVANHGLGHLLRALDRGLTLARREALHFNDVAVLAL